jgi:hypothetical protein
MRPTHRQRTLRHDNSTMQRTFAQVLCVHAKFAKGIAMHVRPVKLSIAVLFYKHYSSSREG